MAANSLSAQDVYALRPGDELIIPGDEPVVAGAVAASAAPTVPPRTYTVQSGDTPIAIANSLGVTVEALMAANNLSNDDARRLRAGQVLIVPGGGQSTGVTAPVAAIPVAANPVAPSAAPQAFRLDPPQLRSPENSAQVSCDPGNTLAWMPVNFMRESDQYLLHLGFVSGTSADGRELITWVLEQVQSANNTIWPMDPGLCGLAPKEYGRKWYWYIEVVEIVNNARVRVSAPSDSWAFSWN
jgi:LysM repeat protein